MMGWASAHLHQAAANQGRHYMSVYANSVYHFMKMHVMAKPIGTLWLHVMMPGSLWVVRPALLATPWPLPPSAHGPRSRPASLPTPRTRPHTRDPSRPAQPHTAPPLSSPPLLSRPHVELHVGEGVGVAAVVIVGADGRLRVCTCAVRERAGGRAGPGAGRQARFGTSSKKPTSVKLDRQLAVQQYCRRMTSLLLQVAGPPAAANQVPSPAGAGLGRPGATKMLSPGPSPGGREVAVHACLRSRTHVPTCCVPPSGREKIWVK